MKRYIAIYGGTQLSDPVSSFVKDLSYALLDELKVVLVTGGFNYFSKDPTTVSTDTSVLKGARIFAKEKKVDLTEIFETWLPDTEKDRNDEGVVRFHEGNVKDVAGESAQARRFSMVRDVHGLITIKGQINTAMVLDFALAINKPALPLPFTGGDSMDYWNANKKRIMQWFGIDETLANELEIDDIENLSLAKRKNLIDKILAVVETGLTCEKINNSKYESDQQNWEFDSRQDKRSITEQQVLENGNGSKAKKINSDIKETAKAKFFLSYSHKDEKLKEQLDNHLTALKRSDKISVWNDRKIDGGRNWDQIIRQQLEAANFILLLLSADFMASQYIWNIEVKLAIQRHEQEKARVIPIFLRKCDFEDMPFERLQGYPLDAKPVTSFPEREQDEVFYNIVKGIREDLKKWLGI